MKNLIQKIFSRLGENKPTTSTTFSADEIKPLFEANGIDIETIGFPDITNRHRIPFDAYWAIFSDVKLTPVKIDEKVSTIITGRYESQSKASYQDKYGGWHPGSSSFYNFKIKEGKLDIRRR